VTSTAAILVFVTTTSSVQRDYAAKPTPTAA
jgi:hypothetical protein